MTNESTFKRHAQIYLPDTPAALSAERRTALLEAFAAMLKISVQAIEVYGVYEGSLVFDLGLPPPAVQYLRALLQTNNPQLRLLGVEKVFLERESGEFEAWSRAEEKFKLAASSRPLKISRDRRGKLWLAFEPVPGIWRFHLIYLLVTVAMGLSMVPYPQGISLFLLGGACLAGIGLCLFQRILAAHILALAIGLVAPVVVLAKLPIVQTTIFLAGLIGVIFLARRYLF